MEEDTGVMLISLTGDVDISVPEGSGDPLDGPLTLGETDPTAVIPDEGPIVVGVMLDGPGTVTTGDTEPLAGVTLAGTERVGNTGKTLLVGKDPPSLGVAVGPLDEVETPGVTVGEPSMVTAGDDPIEELLMAVGEAFDEIDGATLADTEFDGGEAALDGTGDTSKLLEGGTGDKSGIILAAGELGAMDDGNATEGVTVPGTPADTEGDTPPTDDDTTGLGTTDGVVVPGPATLDGAILAVVVPKNTLGVIVGDTTTAPLPDGDGPEEPIPPEITGEAEATRLRAGDELPSGVLEGD